MIFGLKIRNDFSQIFHFSVALLMIITISSGMEMFLPLRNVCRLTNFQFPPKIELAKAERENKQNVFGKKCDVFKSIQRCANHVD